jgi:AraC family transcriptional regulator, melibiose operon regulatory protein
MAKRDDEDAPQVVHTVPLHERHFYRTTRAFGRFGIRQFEPQLMDEPHWHGHIEFNLCQNAEMVYAVDGETIHVPPGRLCVFWAGVPHRLSEINKTDAGKPRLSNIYLPVDSFLAMPHIAKLQVALLSGAMALIPAPISPVEKIDGWYRDYRAGDFERSEVVRMELNALLRRAQLDDLEWLRHPLEKLGVERTLSSSHMRHVIEMLRYVLEHLAEPMSNADITRVTGLHENYALTLFTRTMRMPLKKFVIRLRLLRARGLLTESSTAITTVAEKCGFSSISQFYQHFKSAYGLPPNAVRDQYVRMELR